MSHGAAWKTLNIYPIFGIVGDNKYTIFRWGAPSQSKRTKRNAKQLVGSETRRLHTSAHQVIQRKNQGKPNFLRTLF